MCNDINEECLKDCSLFALHLLAISRGHPSVLRKPLCSCTAGCFLKHENKSVCLRGKQLSPGIRAGTQLGEQFPNLLSIFYSVKTSETLSVLVNKCAL